MRSLLTIKTAAALLVLGLSGSLAQANPGVNFVADCYQRFLHRPADGYGINYWVNKLQCTGSPLVVQAGILGSEEYWCSHGGTPEGYIVGLYNDVLGRQPRPDEIFLWNTRFVVGGACREKLACEFLNAAQVELGIRASQTPQVIACSQPVLAQPAPTYVPQPTYSIPQQPGYGVPQQPGYVIPQQPGYSQPPAYVPTVPNQELNFGIQTTRVTTRRVDPRPAPAAPLPVRGGHNYPRY